MPRRVTGFALAAIVLTVAAAEPSGAVAVVLGRTIYPQDLVVPVGRGEPRSELPPDARQRVREERLRALVWSAVFEDYTRQRQIEATEAEVDSHIRHHLAFREQEKLRRESERARLTEELKSPGLAETRRRQAQQYLDTLTRIEERETQLAQERRDPARAKQWQDAERRVAQLWVKRWKVNQALHREFGGRVVFQQAGWEPIDAYRRLLEQYQAREAFVVHDPQLKDAVYGYFKYSFVYADEAKARFYFEKPWWERTPEEIKAAGL
jgi:hypothetical protein